MKSEQIQLTSCKGFGCMIAMEFASANELSRAVILEARPGKLTSPVTSRGVPGGHDESLLPVMGNSDKLDDRRCPL